jgi:alkyl hydroperoxide reductase subunit AhpC
MAIRLGQDAPNFSTEAINGGGEFVKVTLSEISASGKWTVLYVYPFDWTGVCLSEIQDFDKKVGKFSEANCQLVGCSTDSKFSHKEWLASGKITADKTLHHPVLADFTKNISRDYGVLNDAAGFAFRGTFIIDPKGKVRHYAANEALVGRNPDEVYRVLKGLQQVDAGGGACMVNWQPK